MKDNEENESILDRIFREGPVVTPRSSQDVAERMVENRFEDVIFGILEGAGIALRGYHEIHARVVMMRKGEKLHDRLMDGAGQILAGYHTILDAYHEHGNEKD